MKHNLNYKSERKHFTITFSIILSFIAIIAYFYFLGIPDFLHLYLTLTIVSLWAYSEYHHIVIMRPLTFELGYSSGKLEMMKEFKEMLEKKKKRKQVSKPVRRKW